MAPLPRYLVAVDNGNSAAKVGIASFDVSRASLDVSRASLDTSRASLDNSRTGWTFAGPVERIEDAGAWDRLSLPSEPLTWVVSSVHSPRAANLRDWLAAERPADELVELTWQDVPLPHDVEAPERVGMDRWMGCVAAAKRWGQGASGVVVLAGTAITVNLLREGVFAGGAILPGFDLALHSLHHGTDKLPDLTGRLERLAELPGRETIAAMYAGVGWGTVGAVREIGSRMTQGLREPRWAVSGGNAEMLAEGLGIDVEIAPTLTLEGIVETYLALRRDRPKAAGIEG